MLVLKKNNIWYDGSRHYELMERGFDKVKKVFKQIDTDCEITGHLT